MAHTRKPLTLEQLEDRSAPSSLTDLFDAGSSGSPLTGSDANAAPAPALTSTTDDPATTDVTPVSTPAVPTTTDADPYSPPLLEANEANEANDDLFGVIIDPLAPSNSQPADVNVDGLLNTGTSPDTVDSNTSTTGDGPTSPPNTGPPEQATTPDNTPTEPADTLAASVGETDTLPATDSDAQNTPESVRLWYPPGSFANDLDASWQSAGSFTLDGADSLGTAESTVVFSQSSIQVQEDIDGVASSDEEAASEAPIGVATPALALGQNPSTTPTYQADSPPQGQPPRFAIPSNLPPLKPGHQWEQGRTAPFQNVDPLSPRFGQWGWDVEWIQVPLRPGVPQQTGEPPLAQPLPQPQPRPLPGAPRVEVILLPPPPVANPGPGAIRIVLPSGLVLGRVGWGTQASPFVYHNLQSFNAHIGEKDTPLKEGEYVLVGNQPGVAPVRYTTNPANQDPIQFVTRATAAPLGWIANPYKANDLAALNQAVKQDFAANPELKAGLAVGQSSSFHLVFQNRPTKMAVTRTPFGYEITIVSGFAP